MIIGRFRNRWIYAGVICGIWFVSGYFMVIHAIYNKYAQLQQKQNKIQMHLISLAAKSQNTFVGMTKQTEINKSGAANVMQVAEQFGLNVQSIRTTKNMIHIVLKAHFTKWFAFISSFYFLKLENVICHLNKLNQLEIEADLHLSDVPRILPHKIIKNPFCDTFYATHIFLKDNHAALQGTSIQLIKMVGYVKENTDAEAIMLMPNNALIAISSGAIIGKEHGVVVFLDKNHIQLLMPNNKTFEIKMRA